MNEITTTNGNAVGVNQQTNFFESYGEQVNQKTIVGTLLKFSKGDYTAGESNEDIPIGTKFIAHMDQLLVGWIRWENSKPTDQLMGAVVKGFQAAKRSTLGDDDQSQWEVDNNGKARDPWQYSNYIVLEDPDSAGSLYTFATSSRGGINAIGDLSLSYGKIMRTKGNEWPIIAIGVDSYVHSDRSYGRIKVPTFKIVGWAAKSAGDATAGEMSALDDGPDIKPADSNGRAPRGSGGYADPTARTATKF